MNRVLDPIDLASEADFSLGRVTVRPALRLFAANGVSETLEPRVMQVLVSLARRAGEVVGRDELIATCWDGRVVGDDAVQRAVAKVRKLGENSGAFGIETISKVGYLLKAAGMPASSTGKMQNARPSLAILPFIDRANVTANELAVESLVEDLAATLALTRPFDFNVIAPSATAGYRATTKNPLQIGQELAADYLLEGAVRRIDAGVRLSVQLIDSETGNILWTQKFDHPQNGASALHEDMVTELAALLCVKLEGLEIEHALKRPSNTTAWDSEKRALAYATRNTRSGCEAAAAEAARATEIAPNDGTAHSIHAAMLTRLVTYGIGDTSELERKIIDAARRARELEPNNPGVLSGIAGALADLGKLADALLLAERAVTINASFANGRMILGSVLARMWRPDEALAELDAMESLAPNSVWRYRSLLWRSVAYLQTNRLNQALDAADQALRLAPNIESLAQNLLCLAEANRWDCARERLGRFRDSDREMSRDLLQRLVQISNLGSTTVDRYVADIAKIWDDVAQFESNTA